MNPTNPTNRPSAPQRAPQRGPIVRGGLPTRPGQPAPVRPGQAPVRAGQAPVRPVRPGQPVGQRVPQRPGRPQLQGVEGGRSGRLNTGPLGVGLHDESPVIAAGLAAVLTAAGADAEVVSDEALRPIDVLLVDPHGRTEADLRVVAANAARHHAAIITYGWRQPSATLTRALGARAHLDKGADGAEAAAIITAVAHGDAVPTAAPRRSLEPAPGEDLSGREREVLELIGEGLSNQDIARTLYVTINTVKTYVRGAYRKIGATNRTQALLWLHEHRAELEPVLDTGAA